MENIDKSLQTSRVLNIYRRLIKGEVIHKGTEARRFGVTEKTIHRDIDEIRNLLADVQNDGEVCELRYSRVNKGYIMTDQSGKLLTGSEILAISKILLDSRAFSRYELNGLLNKLIHQGAPDEKKQVHAIISNEQYHYEAVKHGKDLIEIIWYLSQAIKEQRLIQIKYKKENHDHSFVRIVEPLGILFSEYYFYLTACICDTYYDFPTIYRIDRIQDLITLKDGFSITHCKRFEDGEFRKRVQFMQSGPLLRIKFKFWGKSLEAVIDRLPTAKVIGTEGDCVLVEAEVFGQGIKMWLLSQGDNLEVIEPKEFREEMKTVVKEMGRIYELGLSI